MDESSNIQAGEFLQSVDGNKKIIVACACALALGNLYGDNAHARDSCLVFHGYTETSLVEPLN